MDPVMRRFISRDPAEADVLGCLYSAFDNNSGSLTDPMGLEAGDMQDRVLSGIIEPMMKFSNWVAGLFGASSGNSTPAKKSATKPVKKKVSNEKPKTLDRNGIIDMLHAIDKKRSVAGYHTYQGMEFYMEHPEIDLIFLAPGILKAAGVRGIPLIVSKLSNIAKSSGDGILKLSGRNGGKITMNSSNKALGVEKASANLLESVSKKRTVTIAKEGSEELRYLNYIGAEANVGGANMKNILLRKNPSKAAVLEEFLHGTQHRLDIIERLGHQGLGSAETHVKDFMIRHSKMLGLSDADVVALKALKAAGK